MVVRGRRLFVETHGRLRKAAFRVTGIGAGSRTGFLLPSHVESPPRECHFFLHLSFVVYNMYVRGSWELRIFVRNLDKALFHES